MNITLNRCRCRALGLFAAIVIGGLLLAAGVGVIIVINNSANAAVTRRIQTMTNSPPGGGLTDWSRNVQETLLSGEQPNVMALVFDGIKPVEGHEDEALAGGSVFIQRSTNLVDWVTILHITNESAPFQLSDDPSPPADRAFYRGMWVPR